MNSSWANGPGSMNESMLTWQRNCSSRCRRCS